MGDNNPKVCLPATKPSVFVGKKYDYPNTDRCGRWQLTPFFNPFLFKSMYRKPSRHEVNYLEEGKNIFLREGYSRCKTIKQLTKVTVVTISAVEREHTRVLRKLIVRKEDGS